jgi:AraC-like DNA-binding protein
MAFAKDALSRAGKSIGRLAEEIGYESASALSTAFHKRIGPRRAHLPVPRSVPPNEMPTKVLMRHLRTLSAYRKPDIRRNDEGLDRIDGDVVRTRRLDCRIPTHASILCKVSGTT